jgi:hypothetical protein
MPAMTPRVVSRLDPVATRSAAGSRGGRLVGLAIASLLPAVFWMALIKATATWLGVSPAPHTIWFAGAAITVFLATVCAPLILRRSA